MNETPFSLPSQETSFQQPEASPTQIFNQELSEAGVDSAAAAKAMQELYMMVGTIEGLRANASKIEHGQAAPESQAVNERQI